MIGIGVMLFTLLITISDINTKTLLQLMYYDINNHKDSILYVITIRYYLLVITNIQM